MSEHDRPGSTHENVHEAGNNPVHSFVQEPVQNTAGANVGPTATGFPSGSRGASSPNFASHASTEGNTSGIAHPTIGGPSVTNTRTSDSRPQGNTNQASGNLGSNSPANPKGAWSESGASGPSTANPGTGATSASTTGTTPAGSTNVGGNWTDSSVSSSSHGTDSNANTFSSSTPQTGVKLGKGLDIGTANLVTAVQNEQGGITIKMERNAFIDIEADVYSKKMLTKLQVPYVIHNDRMVVLGDSAFELSNIFSRETRRPMKDGLISPSEIDALGIIRLIIEKIMDAPRVEGEKAYFSVPAASIDRPNNVIYHQGLFEGLLRKMGYTPHPMNEAHAVVFSELAEENFTGIGISCGGGMFNVCVAYKTIPALTFSICRGGDWIDQNVANVLGIPSSKATAIKERGCDLMNPRNREEEAVVIYYRNLMNYTLLNIKQKFEVAQDMPEFPEPIDIVFSGGTSMIGGFAELCDEELKKIHFPIPINRVRRAPDPLSSVARGCLIAAAIGD